MRYQMSEREIQQDINADETGQDLVASPTHVGPEVGQRVIDEGGQSSEHVSPEYGQDLLYGIDVSFERASSFQGETLVDDDGWSTDSWVTTEAGSIQGSDGDDEPDKGEGPSNDQGSDDDDLYSGWTDDMNELLKKVPPNLGVSTQPFEDVTHPFWDPTSAIWQCVAEMATAEQRKKIPDAYVAPEFCFLRVMPYLLKEKPLPPGIYWDITAQRFRKVRKDRKDRKDSHERSTADPDHQARDGEVSNPDLNSTDNALDCESISEGITGSNNLKDAEGEKPESC